MPSATAPQFACPSCGKQYAWKPELAGRKAKCKCGSAIAIPAAMPAAAEADPLELGGFDALEQAAAQATVADTGFRCPSCSQSLTPGTVICVHCGFNLKTGKRMTTATGAQAAEKPAKTAPPGAGLPPSISRRSPSRGEEQGGGKGVLVKALVPLLLIGLIVGAVVGFRTLRGSSEVEHAGPSKGQDREVRAAMKEHGSTELKAWLDAGLPQRMVMGMTREHAAGLADKLYKMGAVKVYAFGGGVSMILAIELPANAEQRKELFHWQEVWHTDMMEKVWTDEGQQFLLIKMHV